jgi:imidazole glycerol-phosphate synthase subunit HisH
MITIIDYGLGNIQALVNLYSRLNIRVNTAKSNSDLLESKKLILPGVGSFDRAMLQLNSSGMRDTLDHLVIEKEIPILGICVGMQMLSNSSEEGNQLGLGWIDGKVKKFNKSSRLFDNYLPHMGWNNVEPVIETCLFKGMEKNKRFYFLHSYFFECNESSNILAKTDYGADFTCAVKKKNIMGVQFHPEKSHHFGEQLLKNYSEI